MADGDLLGKRMARALRHEDIGERYAGVKASWDARKQAREQRGISI